MTIEEQRIFQEGLRKKYFPHTPWTLDGPVRRRYIMQAERGDAVYVLKALAEEEFLLPGEQIAVGFSGPETMELFCRKDNGEPFALILGCGLDAWWCDLAVSTPDEKGWQTLLVRSEAGENLVALANARVVLRFRRG